MSPNKKLKHKQNLLKCLYCLKIFSIRDAKNHLRDEKDCHQLKPFNYFVEGSFNFHFTKHEIKTSGFETLLSLKNDSSANILMNPNTMQIFNLNFGQHVCISSSKAVEVFRVWPVLEIPFFDVALANHQSKSSNESRKLNLLKPVCKATTVEFICLSTSKIFTNLEILLFEHLSKNENSILKLNYLGKTLKIKICAIETDSKVNDLAAQLSNLNLEADDVPSEDSIIQIEPKSLLLNQCENQFFSIDQSTKLVQKFDAENNQVVPTLPAGLQTQFNQISSILSMFLNHKEKFQKSGLPLPGNLLIHGSSGCGKSTLVDYALSKLTCSVVKLSPNQFLASDFNFEGFLSTIETSTVVVIKDLHLLSKSKSLKNEQSLALSLAEVMLNLSQKMFFIGITNSLSTVDERLRKAGRFDMEIEIPTPNNEQRFEILKELLKNTDCSKLDLRFIADSAIGFVGQDLQTLVREASICAVSRNLENSQSNEAVLLMEDMLQALKIVKPSAMKSIVLNIPQVLWSDIGGLEDIKQKLRQSIEWPIKYRDTFKRLNIAVPKGVLLYGPPGCSKTLIAKALATESKFNFISIKGPELFNKWVGESEKAVREIFQKAKQVAPSIIFFDEIDSIASHRTATAESGSNVQERVVAQLLTELDGIESLHDVFIVAATNRPDMIDKAIIRPGRIDRLIYMPLPNLETRKEIFKIACQKTAISEDVDFEDLAKLTENYSGAEIQAVCQEAGMNAIQADPESVCAIKMDDFRAGLALVKASTELKLLEVYKKFSAT